MLWIIQLPNKPETEIWSEEKLEMMRQKCLFYGATPHWIQLRAIPEKADTGKTLMQGNGTPYWKS